MPPLKKIEETREIVKAKRVVELIVIYDTSMLLVPITSTIFDSNYLGCRYDFRRVFLVSL